jgi:glycosyltransferase involved in cell wall biosynthesis
MKVAFVSRHCPRPEGTPTGRIFYAVGEGLVAEGHEVQALAWAPDQPHEDLPSWCTWMPVPPEPAWRMKGRALVRPRRDVARIDWAPDDDAIVIAEDPISFPLVAGRRDAAAVFHYLTVIDAPALRRPTAKDVQDMRLERRIARTAPRPLAFSERVARRSGVHARVIPMAYPMPPEPLPLVDEPVALLFANWEWPPNARALSNMLDQWPSVRAEVPSARLVLAGWGLDAMGVPPVAGVEVIGAVARAEDALARAAVLAFPCPPTSGPKVKVLEALGFGVPVVTTPAGAEGLVLAPDDGVVVTGEATFAAALAAVLRDPERRATLGSRGRAAALAHHSPRAAARARLAAVGAT